MVYIRSKKIRDKTYYYLVEGKKDKKGKVKQKVLFYIGNKEKLLKLYHNIKKKLDFMKEKMDEKEKVEVVCEEN